MGDVTNGFIMAGVSIALGLVGSILYCFYINTLENNTDRPHNKETNQNENVDLHDIPTNNVETA